MRRREGALGVGRLVLFAVRSTREKPGEKHIANYKGTLSGAVIFVLRLFFF